MFERLIRQKFSETLLMSRQTVALEFVELCEEFARRGFRRVEGRLVSGPFFEKLSERIGHFDKRERRCFLGKAVVVQYLHFDRLHAALERRKRHVFLVALRTGRHLRERRLV